MAELEGKAEIVPAGEGIGQMVQGDGGRYSIQISEFDGAGNRSRFAIALPDDEKWGGVMLRAAILKRSVFQSADIPTIIHAVIYADNLGLDIMAGDVYLVNGRVATSNKAKIKSALATGRVKGIKADIAELPQQIDLGKYKGPELECTATIMIEGWAEPLVRKAKLSQWYKGSNPNWVERPHHMLELNTVAHACEYVAPGGTDADEAPPASIPYPTEQGEFTVPLAQSIAATAKRSV